MANYELQIKRSARKELESLPAKDCSRLTRKIAANPHPSGAEKLSGEEKYRVRQGDYRVLYEIDDDAQQVTIVKIGHRGDVYR